MYASSQACDPIVHDIIVPPGPTLTSAGYEAALGSAVIMWLSRPEVNFSVCQAAGSGASDDCVTMLHMVFKYGGSIQCL